AINCLVKGYVGKDSDLLLRGVIGAGWLGRGPCVVINDRCLELCGIDPHQTRESFHEILLHEFAHVVLDLVAAGAEPYPQLPGDIVEELSPGVAVAQAVLPRPARDSQEWLANCRDHDDRFLRVLWHVRRRAELLGVSVNAVLFPPGLPFDIGCAGPWITALGD